MSISIEIDVEYGHIFERIGTAELRAYLQLRDFADGFVGPPHRQDAHRVRMSRLCSHEVALEGEAWEDEVLEEISDARIMRYLRELMKTTAQQKAELKASVRAMPKEKRQTILDELHAGSFVVGEFLKKHELSHGQFWAFLQLHTKRVVLESLVKETF